MSGEEIAFGIGTTIAQIGVTAFIAWYAVKAALERFKAERSWERRVDAYTSALSALGEVQTSLGHWVDRLETNRSLGTFKERERFEMARTNFETTYAIATLLLPESIGKELNLASLALDAVVQSSPYREFEPLNHAYAQVESTMRILASEGKKHLSD